MEVVEHGSPKMGHCSHLNEIIWTDLSNRNKLQALTIAEYLFIIC